MSAGQGLNDTLIVEEDGQGQRLDVWLTEELDMTRSQLKNYIAQGRITVNGHSVKAGLRLETGQIVEIRIPTPQKTSVEAQAIPLTVVYEDEAIIVINKPAGMVVHPAAGHWDGTLVNALLAHCQDLSGIGGEIRPGIVHRLDKDTTGLLVAAKTDQAHGCLAEQIRRRSMKRHYRALIHGRLKTAEGTIEGSIGRHPGDRKKMALVGSGRDAVTHYTVLETLSQWSLVECRLETGRTHQIRVHFAGIQHPLVGDPLYGWNRHELGAQRQLLHAHYLALQHPNGQDMEFQAELPQDFVVSLEKARKIP